MSTQFSHAQPPPQESAPSRVSRYRSVRKKVSAEAAGPIHAAPPLAARIETSPSSAGPLERSRSRYRKTAQPAHNKATPSALPDSIKLTTATSQNSQASAPKPVLDGQPSAGARQYPVRKSSFQKPNHASHTSPIASLQGQNTANLIPNRAGPPSARDQAREEARHLLEGEVNRLREMQEKSKLEKLEERKRRAELEETRRTRAEMDAQAHAHRQKAIQQEVEREAAMKRKKEEEEQVEIARRMRERQRELQIRAARRLGSTDKLDTAVHSQQQALTNGIRSKTLQSPQDQGRSSSQGVFGFMKRRRGDTVDGSDTQAVTGVDLAAGNQSIHAAGLDAPISAVNAGERHVLVECQSKSVWLPVTPTTTPRDLVRSAATFLTVPIDPKASVLMESFGKVGVQRPLRNYEHVRDVLNSWDDDKQNSLVLLPSATGGNDSDLEASSILKDEPLGFECAMHYSQKPGRWDKRWVSLRPDGQVTLAKKQGVKPSDQTNVCHISDFDIYTPSQRDIGRKIRPPKRLCFAIKSQQKSNLFESLESFVHFFCTNDKKLAAAFYRVVQGWRSWYLVNMMGAGQETRDKAAAAVVNGPPNLDAGHRRGASKDSLYQLGSFKPLIDMTVFNAATSPSNDATKPTHARQKPSRTNAEPPPSSFPRHAGHHDRKLSALARTDEEPFAPTGLLGRTYSQRQRALETREKVTDGPFTTATGLVSAADPAPATAPLPAEAARRPLVALATTTPAAPTASRGGPVPKRSSSRVRDVNQSPSRTVGEVPRRPLVAQATTTTATATAFAEGSLLRQVEMREGVRAPALDRSKGREVEVGTGEGA